MDRVHKEPEALMHIEVLKFAKVREQDAVICGKIWSFAASLSVPCLICIPPYMPQSRCNELQELTNNIKGHDVDMLPRHLRRRAGSHKRRRRPSFARRR